MPGATACFCIFCTGAAARPLVIAVTKPCETMTQLNNLVQAASKLGAIQIKTQTNTAALLFPSQQDAKQIKHKLQTVKYMWEPQDWEKPHTSFRKEIIRTSHHAITVEPCAGATQPHITPLQMSRNHSRLILLEHPHAFLTTSAGRMHVTTLILLKLALERVCELRRAEHILDYGCGSGVLGLAALSFSETAKAFAVDVHDAAIAASGRNALLNGFAESRYVACWPWELPSSLQADVALVNMMAGPLLTICTELATKIRVGGLLLISGIRESDVCAIRGAFGRYFSISSVPSMVCEGRADEGGGRWLGFTCRRLGTVVGVCELSEGAVE